MSARRSDATITANIIAACAAALVWFIAPGILGAGDNVTLVSSAPLAASAGPNFAGTATSGTWSSPANATGPNDNVCANVPVNNSGPIDLTNFSFSIPTGSTITGILVEPKGAYGIASFSATLLKAGAPVGAAKSFSPANAPVCAGTAFASLGGAGDLWGTTWTVSDINAINFGVRITNAAAEDTNSYLDAVRITILFDPPPPAHPAEVPEADTLILFGGGLGGLTLWLGWQTRRIRARKSKS